MADRLELYRVKYDVHNLRLDFFILDEGEPSIGEPSLAPRIFQLLHEWSNGKDEE